MHSLQCSRRATRVQAPVIPIIGDLTRNAPGTLSLGQGVVRYGPPESASQALKHYADSGTPLYGPVAGDPELLAAIRQKLASDNAIACGDEVGVMVTAGANLAFANVVFALVDPGDEVLLPAPYYFNHEMAISLANAHPIPVPTTEDRQLDIDRIEAAITPRTKAIVTVSPNNPTGAVYTRDSLNAVNRLCAERGLAHISDEAYEYFTFDGARHHSPASETGAEAHTISIFSLSKSFGFAAGRIGYFVYPRSMDSALRKIQDTWLICPARPSQAAAAACLAEGAPYPQARLPEIAESRATLGSGLAALGARIQVSPSRGAFYYLVRLMAAVDDMEVAQRLVTEFGVATLPGRAFGDPLGPSLRLSFGAIAPAQVEEATARLQRGLNALLTQGN